MEPGTSGKKVYSGTDGRVRVVNVKTANKTLKRAVTKIAPLPVKRTSVLITTLLALMSITPVKTESSAWDVTKTAIEGAVTVYTSDTTKQWLGTRDLQKLSYEKIRELNANLNSPKEKQQSAEYSMAVILTIFGACALWFIIAFIYILCVGRKTSKKNKRSSSYELVNRTKQAKCNTNPDERNIDARNLAIQQAPMFNDQQLQMFLHECRRMTEYQVRTLVQNERENIQQERHETAQMQTATVAKIIHHTPVPQPRTIEHKFINVLDDNELHM